ncbi:hypothetical protein OESDEN_13306, partial [Oesophagostomum dentatum]
LVLFNKILLKDSSVRIQIDETEASIRKRFVPEIALNGEPVQEAFSAVEIKSDSAHLTTGDKKLKVVVVYKPFVIHVYNELNELIAQVNRDGKLKVEEYRTKEEGKEYPENFWEESFKSFTDTKPFGSSSVGVDISFVGFRSAYGLPEHADSFALKTTVGSTDPYRLYNLDVFEYEVGNPMSLYVAIPYIIAHKKNATVDISFVGFRSAYGLPEHADSFALKTTVGSTDPYRLYNLDVFEYEVGNPMSLYVAIPYIIAHKKNATVGALWLNSAETWIDTKSSASGNGFFRSVIDKVMSTENVPHFDAHFMSETGLVDIFLFGGPSPRDVQRQLSETTGVR